jgi:glycosyltransferase involved in cell wall biosynthesis
VRVLFNTYPVAFGCPGGGEIQLLRNKEALEALGVEVLLFDPWHPQFDRVDLVHYFSVQGGSSCFCDYVKSIGLPLLISPILWLTDENRSRFPMGEIHELLRRCDRVLPNSKAECDQLGDVFDLDSEKFSVVPNGVDARFGVPADPLAFRRKFDISGPFLLNVANVEPRKNQRLLSQVAAQMNLDLILLGNVRDHDYLAACLSAGRGRVRHVGALDHEDPLLASAYRACEVFVLPSLLETPGLSALEAAAQGARLVVTSVGSTREYFHDLVSYVTPADPTSVRRAIETQWAARSDDRLRHHVLTHWSWSQAAKALVDAYNITLLAASSVR